MKKPKTPKTPKAPQSPSSPWGKFLLYIGVIFLAISILLIVLGSYATTSAAGSSLFSGVIFVIIGAALIGRAKRRFYEYHSQY